MSRQKQLLISAALLLAVLVMSYIGLRYFVAPFAWAALFCAGALFAAIRMTNSSGWQALWLNMAIVAMVLGAFEGYLHIGRAPARRDTVESLDGTPQKMTAAHEILGYAPIPNLQGIWSRTIGDDHVFRSEFSIDGHGLRVGPTAHSADLPCVFFFGGSYTFGSGVNDEEAMPYLVAADFLRQYRVFNFGFRGYGPHQMLAALEHDIYGDSLGCQPTHAIYQMIPDHVSRAAGFASWDENGPQYELNAQGVAMQIGTFARGKQEPPGKLLRILNRSLIVQRLKQFTQARPDEKSADLTFAILQRAQEIVQERSSVAQFHVIYWPADQSLLSLVVDKLERNGFDLHPISTVLPEFNFDRAQYRFHRYDGHPNVRAHRLIADYVGREILGIPVQPEEDMQATH